MRTTHFTSIRRFSPSFFAKLRVKQVISLKAIGQVVWKLEPTAVLQAWSIAWSSNFTMIRPYIDVKGRRLRLNFDLVLGLNEVFGIIIVVLFFRWRHEDTAFFKLASQRHARHVSFIPLVFTLNRGNLFSLFRSFWFFGRRHSLFLIVWDVHLVGDARGCWTLPFFSLLF